MARDNLGDNKHAGMQNDFAEEQTELLDDAAEVATRAELAQAETQAIDALYTPGDVEGVSDASGVDADDARLTELLTPIGQTSRPVMPVVKGPTESVERTMQRNEGRFRHGVAAAIISVLLLFGIGLGAGMYTKHVKSEQETAAMMAENERRAAEAQEAQALAEAEAEEAARQEAAHAPRALKFILSASEYDSLATRVPLVITGIDLDGNEVQTEGFINAEGEGLSLIPGEYTASIPASPIKADGGLYAVPSSTYSFRVPNDDQELIQVDQAIVLIPLNLAELNDDAINNAYNWAIKDAQFASVAENNAAAARKIIEEEKARKAAEEKRKQMEEQRAPLAQQFAEDFFTNVGFPDEKDDSKVLVITNWNAMVSQYVASGSSAESKIGNGNGARYSFATRVSVASISGESITVDVDLVSGDEITNGWTLNKSTKHVSCTFNDDNKIVDFSIS